MALKQWLNNAWLKSHKTSAEEIGNLLAIYKKLCRSYFDIDQEATVFYVNAYREMWDEKVSTTNEINNPEPDQLSRKKTRKTACKKSKGFFLHLGMSCLRTR